MLHQLTAVGAPVLPTDFWLSCHDMEKRVDKLLAENHLEDKKDLARKLKISLPDFLTTEDRFSWIKNDDRVCLWIWLTLKNDTLAVWQKPTKYIELTKLPQQPSGHTERYDAIVQYIDVAIDTTAKTTSYMDLLKSSWNNRRSTKSNLSWINPEQPKQIEWCWEYLYKNPPFGHYVQQNPTNTHEKYLYCLAWFDTWQTPSSDTIELFLIKMKKAWSQKKFRDNQQERRTYSFSLKPGTREQLTQVANNHSMKDNEVLEKLIRDARIGDISQLSERELETNLLKAEEKLAQCKRELAEAKNEITKLKSAQNSGV